MARGVPRKIANRVNTGSKTNGGGNSPYSSDSDDDFGTLSAIKNGADVRDLVFGDIPSQQIPAKRAFIFLLSFSFLLIISIGLFLSGFLLSRVELPNISSCNLRETFPNISSIDDKDPKSFFSSWSYFSSSKSNSVNLADIEASGCWLPKRYKKTVFIIIDALRFDFTKYDETYDVKYSNVKKSKDNEYDFTDSAFTGSFAFKNKMPFIKKLLSKDYWGHSLLFRGLADPPTTTLQRIKALTTGTLPTFVDAGANFFGQEIAEDNIIHKLNAFGKNVIFMGDDTWENTYTNRFNQSFPYPSLEVWDLHTVDNGILKHLHPTLEGKENKDWDVLIAHFLGVDHAGHRYGPSHPEMSKKLLQMDGVLQDVVEKLDDETLLVVIGDHGMDNKGDHGGDSENELNAAMFLYSKKELFNPALKSNSTNEAKFFNKYLNLLEQNSLKLDSTGPFVFQYGDRTFPQIDLVPSLSLLLGLPIPYGNLGTIIPELFYVNDKEFSGYKSWQRLLDASRINAHQIHSYLAAYDTLTYGKLLTPDLQRDFSIAESQYHLVGEGKKPISKANEFDDDDDTILLLISNFISFTRKALTVARKNWARFDLKLISYGVVGLTFTIISLFLFIYFDSSIDRDYNPITFIFGSLFFIVLGLIDTYGLKIIDYKTLNRGIGSLSSNSASTVDKLLKIVYDEYDSTSVDIKFTIAFWFVLGFSISYIISTLSRSWLTTSLVFKFIKSQLMPRDYKNALNPIVLLSVLLYGFTIASDCFTIFEDHATHHILQALTFGTIIWNYYNHSDPSANSESKNISKEISHRDNAITLLAIFMVLTRLIRLPTVCREEQAPYCIPTFYSDSTSSISAWWTIPTLAIVHLVVYLSIRKLLKHGDNSHSAGIVISEYTLPILMFVGWVYWALDTYENSVDTQKAIGNDIISLLIRNVSSIKYHWARILFPFAILSGFCLYIQDPSTLSVDIIPRVDTKELKASPKLHIRGLANSAPSSLLVISSIVYVILQLFQKPMGAIALGIEYLMLMIIISIPTENVPLSVRFVMILLTSKLGFFGTGHQYNLASIHWDTSTIGLRKLSFIFSPIPVLLNTFGAQMLAASAFPIAMLWMNRIKSPTEFLKLLLFGWTLPRVFELWVSVIIATLHRRHLMVWRVFAPKMLFLGLECVFTLTFLGCTTAIIVSTYIAYFGRNRFLDILHSFIASKNKNE